MSAPSLPDDVNTVIEIGWVARRARELVHGDPTDAELVEFYTRKAAVLEYIGEPEMAEQARWFAAAFAPGDES